MYEYFYVSSGMDFFILTSYGGTKYGDKVVPLQRLLEGVRKSGRYCGINTLGNGREYGKAVVTGKWSL